MKDSREQGMTLVEVLVGLSILALLALGMFETLRIAERTETRSSRILQSSDDLRIAQIVLRRIVESAYPVRRDGVRYLHYGLESDGQSMSVLARSPGIDNGLTWYQIDTEPGTRGFALSVHWNEAPASRAPESEVLIEGIESLQWEFLARSAVTNPAPTGWIREWHEGKTLPALVKLTAHFANRDLVWPTFIAAPMITDDATCEFDVTAQSCRDEGT